MTEFRFTLKRSERVAVREAIAHEPKRFSEIQAGMPGLAYELFRRFVDDACLDAQPDVEAGVYLYGVAP